MTTHLEGSFEPIPCTGDHQPTLDEPVPYLPTGAELNAAMHERARTEFNQREAYAAAEANAAAWRHPSRLTPPKPLTRKQRRAKKRQARAERRYDRLRSGKWLATATWGPDFQSLDRNRRTARIAVVKQHTAPPEHAEMVHGEHYRGFILDLSVLLPVVVRRWR